MFRKRFFNVLATIAVMALILSQYRAAEAAKIDFGGEPVDHFWTVEISRFCRDGYTISALETNHFGDPNEIGDEKAFSLQLGSSSPSVQDSLPAQIAGGSGIKPRSLASGTRTFLFTAVQSAGTPVSITIERWDHGLLTSHEDEEEEDGSDGSGFDDNIAVTSQSVEACLLSDTTAPVTTAFPSPAPNANGWNNTNVTVQLNAVDEAGGSGLKEITYSATGAQPIGAISVAGASATISLTAEGSTTITYFATDNSDNAESPHTLTVNIDKTSPNITITSPQAQDYPHSATVPVTWVASDALSGIVSSSGALDGSPVSNGQTLDLLLLNPGVHTLVVSASDNAGNSAQASVTFNIVVTIDSLIDATQRACSMGWISKKGTCQSLLAKLRVAKASLGRGQTQAARGQLNAFLNELRAQKGKSVNQSAYDLLKTDANYLLNTIQSKK